MSMNPRGRVTAGWHGAPPLPHDELAGRYVTLEPLDVSHALTLHCGLSEDASGALWDYMAYGPFANEIA